MSLKILEIKISNWDNSRVPQACIDRKKDVFKYFCEIGFNNPKNLKRWKKFTAPVV